MKTYLLILLGATLILSASKPPQIVKTIKERQFSTPDGVGSTPRFTTDGQGNPVLSWVEKTGDMARFYFAVSTDGGQTFGPKINVPTPGTISTHAEGMPKLAFKADGTVLALFEVPRPTAGSPFAGDLLYVTSVSSPDKPAGQTWTAPKPIYADSSPGKSHSFSELNRLPSGEIGIVWLDDKLPGQEGRPVKFLETRPGGGFGPEVLVDENACQCCRTNVFVDDQNRIHLTYRDMLDKTGTEPAARDISHVVSGDGGKTFTKPVVVLSDNWRVNACPHAGPAVAQVGNAVFATWFSGKEGAIGLRLARLGIAEPVAMIRSERAKHPQVVNLDNQLVWLWDESVKKEKVTEDEAPYAQKIALRLMNGTLDKPATYLTSDRVNASYPVGLATKSGLLVAYEQHQGPNKSVIMCQWVSVR